MKSTNEELANRLSKLGSRVNVSSGDRSTTLNIRCLSKNLDATLAIAAERLLEPKFDPADFDRLKTQYLQSIETQKKEAASIASAVFKRLLYGDDNAFAYPDDGTHDTIEALTLDDVKAFYKDHYSSSLVTVIAVSDVDSAALTTSLGVFGDWEAFEVDTPALSDMPDIAAGSLYLIDKPGAAQSQIRIGKRDIPFDADGEFYKSNLMNYALGGAFNSRINLNLREDKGYSYGARSRFRGDPEVGRYTAGAGVRSDATAESVVEFMKEITKYHGSGITSDELAFTKSSIGQGDARRYETPSQKLSVLADIVVYGLPDTYIDTQSGILSALTQDEVNTLAADHLDPSQMILLVVGDKASIYDKLQALGYPIVELDADGHPVE